MERHKLWNDRAEKLMTKTFESWSKKKKKVYEDEVLDEAPRYNEDYADEGGEQQYGSGESLLDLDDYNMLKKAVSAPVDRLLAGGYTKEDLVQAFKMCLGMDGEEIQEMTGAEEYEDPEVQKAAEKAKRAKIDSVKAQLKALQKQR
jgi:hypothetical protein